MRRRLLAVAVLAATVLAACGGGGSGDAKNELRETTQRLTRIKSGDLSMRMLVLPSTGTKGRVGFTINGPFALRSSGMPVLDVTYTQYTGKRQASARLLSDGRRAVAIAAGKRVALSTTAVQQLTSSGSSGGVTGPLNLDTWLKDPKVSDGGDIGGAATDHISAKLDVVNAANDLLALLRRLGRAAPTITGKTADQLRHAVRSSSVDVWTGKSDKLLRRLDLKARLALDVPAELRRAFGEIVGASFEFELGVAKPNKPVHVEIPAG